jgi:hypothetical protein
MHGAMRKGCKVLVGIPEWEGPLGRLGVDERIKLNWILRKNI